MTNKIIIDGADVSECEYFVDNRCMSVENYNDYCIKNKGCLYKQLKRLQAELKNEKEVEKILNKTLNDTANKLDKILQTNKKQQEIIDAYKLTIFEGKEIIDNYEQALKEIREIATNGCVEKQDCTTCDTYNFWANCIKNKISEVLND